jgi:cation diffusion facilitator CzcD-associated flavoprotein CzcO
MNNFTNKNICIIGAGIAGLVTAKTLSQDGFNVLIIERDSSLGGTWAPSRSYPGLRANNSKFTYAYSDFPYPDDVNTFPFADEIRNYLESYAENFNIRSLILFNQEVSNISQTSENPKQLVVTYHSTNNNNDKITRDFDFVVVCNGVFHTPNIPEIEGKGQYSGKILHSSEVTASTYKNGEKVIIIGGGKSAYDCAAWAARHGVSPTLVFRRPQWMAPRYLPGGRIPGDWLVTSRFFSFFLKYYHSNEVKKLFHRLGKPLIWIWWKFTETGWRNDLKIPSVLNPEETLPVGLEKVGVGGDFYSVYNDGLAKAIRGSIKRFTKDGIELNDDSIVKADLVIFATGWKQDIPFLSNELRKEIYDKGYIWLYRHILPPTVPNLGFIGQASSFASQLTFEIGAHWLSEYFLGSLQIPSVEKMNSEIDYIHKWANNNLANRGSEGFIGPFISCYVDDLLDEMGLSTKREKGFIREYFTLFSPSRIAGLANERRSHRNVNLA